MREPDRERIYEARRAAILPRPSDTGLSAAQADVLVREWEAQAATRSVDRHSSAYWEEGIAWVGVQLRQ